MSMLGLKTTQPILLVGKPMTGKTTGAISKLGDPIIMYANDIPNDIYSLPPDKGLLIEEVHYKADVTAILELLRTYKGEIILTSNNQKDVPTKIKNKCKMSRATRKWGVEYISNIAPNSESPDNLERSMYDIMRQYLQDKDRDAIAKLLKHNKPADNYLMLWLSYNVNPNSIVFLDGHVKRRWSNNYFYELAAYSINGTNHSRLNPPSKGSYSNLVKICRGLGLKGRESHLLFDLLNDDGFLKKAKTKISNADWRKLGLGEKKMRKNKKYFVESSSTLEEW
mgnify:CR=1 FL=1